MTHHNEITTLTISSSSCAMTTGLGINMLLPRPLSLMLFFPAVCHLLVPNCPWSSISVFLCISSHLSFLLLWCSQALTYLIQCLMNVDYLCVISMNFRCFSWTHARSTHVVTAAILYKRNNEGGGKTGSSAKVHRGVGFRFSRRQKE